MKLRARMRILLWTLTVLFLAVFVLMVHFVAGRRTVPIVLGDARTRAALSFGFAAVPVAVISLLIAPVGTAVAWAFGAVLTAWSLVLAVRLLAQRTPRADHITYLLFTAWYCLALIAAVVLL